MLLRSRSLLFVVPSYHLAWCIVNAVIDTTDHPGQEGRQVCLDTLLRLIGRLHLAFSRTLSLILATTHRHVFDTALIEHGAERNKRNWNLYCVDAPATLYT